MRLTTSKKIGIAAVTAAISFICVLVGRYSPVGGFFLLAVAGTMTMFAVRLTGVLYGSLCYVAVALLSILALPFGFFYILLIGPHAVLRGIVFGAPPRKKWRIAVGYAAMTAFAYGISVALYYLAGSVLGTGIVNFVDNLLGGVFIFALICTPIILAYDLAVEYLSGCLERLVKKDKKKAAEKAPQTENVDPFAEFSETDATTVEHVATDRQNALPDKISERPLTDKKERTEKKKRKRRREEDVTTPTPSVGWQDLLRNDESGDCGKPKEDRDGKDGGRGNPTDGRDGKDGGRGNPDGDYSRKDGGRGNPTDGRDGKDGGRKNPKDGRDGKDGGRKNPKDGQ